jgi:hypothetical protein
MVKSVLKLEIISKDTFKENKDKITDIIKEYFDNVENVRYEENNLRSYYVADIEIPITKGLEIEDKILSFSFNGVSLFIRFNNSLFEELNSIILNDFYQFSQNNLSQGDASIVGWDIFMGEYFKAFISE